MRNYIVRALTAICVASTIGTFTTHAMEAEVIQSIDICKLPKTGASEYLVKIKLRNPSDSNKKSHLGLLFDASIYGMQIKDEMDKDNCDIEIKPRYFWNRSKIYDNALASITLDWKNLTHGVTLKLSIGQNTIFENRYIVTLPEQTTAVLYNAENEFYLNKLKHSPQSKEKRKLEKNGNIGFLSQEERRCVKNAVQEIRAFLQTPDTYNTLRIKKFREKDNSNVKEWQDFVTKIYDEANDVDYENLMECERNLINLKKKLKQHHENKINDNNNEFNNDFSGIKTAIRENNKKIDEITKKLPRGWWIPY